MCRRKRAHAYSLALSRARARTRARTHTHTHTHTRVAGWSCLRSSSGDSAHENSNPQKISVKTLRHYQNLDSLKGSGTSALHTR